MTSQSGGTVEQGGGSLVVRICVVLSFLICVPLVLLACSAWWLYWKHQRVPPGVGSFPYRAFALQATQNAVVGCAIVLGLWFTFWCICWVRKRAAKGAKAVRA
ncbi:MAG TPA: hypothetical protein DEF45_05165 [Rhodopirellula sp.]|nr:hypothetical protein [Rhodopirellula sp.]